MVDLGKWLGEDYAISEPLRPDHFLEMEEETERRAAGEQRDEG
jgi:endogenous inhibitor of DNA gyrase (YacG/DUF329 family)